MNEKYILLVEDNPDDEELTLLALKKNNIMNDVVVARDGVEAIEHLFGEESEAAPRPRRLPTLILLDLKLPKMDGLEVLERIRQSERTRYLPVVVLTSSKDDRDILSSYSRGCNSYVRKPVDFSEFIEATRQLGLYWLLLNETPPDHQ